MKHFKILLAAALLVGLAGTASAQSQIEQLGRLKWVRGISSYGLGNTDSTRISIPAAGASVDMADTTEWFDLGSYKFKQDYAKQPLAWFQINKQLTTTTDSIGFQLQFSNDRTSDTIRSVTTVAYITSVAAATNGISAGDDGIIGSVVALSPDAMAAHGAGTAATLPFRWVRLVVYNSDTSGATGRSYFSVTPIIYGQR